MCCDWVFGFLFLFWPLSLSNSLGQGGAWAVEGVWLLLAIGAYVYWKAHQCQSMFTSAVGDVRCGKRTGHQGLHSGSGEIGRKGWRNQKSVSNAFTWQ